MPATSLSAMRWRRVRSEIPSAEATASVDQV